MAAVKTKLGRIKCPNRHCEHMAFLKENEHGSLTVNCDECDCNMVAKKGTAAARSWRAQLPAQSQAPASKEAAPAKLEAPAGAPGKVPAKSQAKPSAKPFDPIAWAAGQLSQGE